VIDWGIGMPHPLSVDKRALVGTIVECNAAKIDVPLASPVGVNANRLRRDWRAARRMRMRSRMIVAGRVPVCALTRAVVPSEP